MTLYKSMFAGLAMSALLLTGCENAAYSPQENMAYITQTNTNANSMAKLTVGNEPNTTQVTVRLSEPAKEDCHFAIGVDKDVLEAYNKRNTTAYVTVPEGAYTIDKQTVTVAKGQVVSDPVNITVPPFSTEMKNSGEKYAIPLMLKSTDGKMAIINGAERLVVALDQVIYTPVPIVNASNNLKPIFNGNGSKNIKVTDWTVEFNVNIDLLGTNIGQLNNQCIFGVWGADGADGEIFTRFGDAPIKGNIFQVKTQGTQLNSNTEFAAGKWYHIAIVCSGGGTKLSLYVNGVLDNSMAMPGKVVNIGTESGQFGNMDYLRANFMISEFRLWTVARSQLEIANNMYVVSPKSDGLFCYFKFNEGQGNSFADATSNGNTCTSRGTTQWVQDVRIDGK